MRQGARPALDVNTLGEVPDSAWYTNRHFHRRMSIEELKRGPGNSTPPNPQGVWRVIAAKSDGVTPGFVIEDERKNRYVLKLDPPQYPELSSAADVIGSKAFYALGYNTPENYIVHFRREQLGLSDGVLWRDAGGKKRHSHESDPRRHAPGAAQGSRRQRTAGWRAASSKANWRGRSAMKECGRTIPNDIFPHEDRRELRGLSVFAAWLNHHDTRSINSMDTLVEENGIRYLKHYLLDFGSILGSSGVASKRPLDREISIPL